MKFSMTHLCGWHSPHLKIVRSHEEISNTFAHHPHYPLVEVLGLGIRDAGLQCSVNHAIHTGNLLVFRQHRDVVLEWVRDPLAFAAHV